MTTPILNITELALGQIDQFLTANSAFRALEAASNDFLLVNLAGGNVTLSATQFASALLFRSSGNAVARTLTIPASKRFFAVHNAGSAELRIERGTAQATIPPGQAMLLYADGSTNGLLAIAGGTGSLLVVTETGTTRTLGLADVGTWLRCTSAGATSVEIPPSSSVSWSIGNTLYVRQSGSGAVTIVAGAGVTVIPPAGGTLVLGGPGASIGLVYIGSNTWEMVGQTELSS